MQGCIHMQARELHIDAVMLWPTFWPRPVTKDWLCQQFRGATMLIVPQHSYKVCLHVHKHCCVHPHICSRWVLCIDTRCTPHTVQCAGTPEWPHPVTNDAEGKHNPRINPSAPSDHPIFGKLDNVRFSARKSFVISDPTHLQIYGYWEYDTVDKNVR